MLVTGIPGQVHAPAAAVPIQAPTTEIPIPKTAPIIVNPCEEGGYTGIVLLG